MAPPILPAYTAYQFMRVTSPAELVAHVEIDRAAKLNAFTRAVWLEFGRAFGQLSRDGEVRAVVVSGAGERAFTAGLDLGSLMGDGAGEGELDAARRAKGLRGHIEEFQGCISEMERCEKPVICVLHGICLGLAIDIACCADIRLASRDARLAVKEVDIGLAADIGTLARLPKIVGSASWVKDVCLSARDFSAGEALRAGFVSEVHDDKDGAVRAAVGMAERLAGKSPVAVQGTKELLNHARENTTAAALRYTAVWNSVALQAGDVEEALGGAFSGGRKRPRFGRL
ncbi:hypothetical protein E4U41_007495 [Claviceps citrina]|nr:hypothetical protein E4U41_007495 [Claviceps citrina]